MDVHGGEEDKKNGIYYHYFKERERETEREEKNKESNALSG